MSSSALRISTLAATTLALALASSQCTSEETSPEERVEQRLERLPGVDEVSMSSETVPEEGLRMTDAEVHMAEGASVDEMEDALAEIEDSKSEFDHSFGGSVVLFDEAGQDDESPSAVITSSETAKSDTDRIAWLVAIDEEMPDLDVLVTGDSVTITSERSTPDSVEQAARQALAAVRDDSRLAQVPMFRFRSTEDHSGDGAFLYVPPSRLDDSLLVTWDELEEASRATPHGVRTSQLSISADTDTGPLDLYLEFEAKGLKAPGFTVRKDGRRMGPLVERLVALAADQEGGAELILKTFSEELQPVEPFLDITTDGSTPTYDDRPDWHRFAQEQLP